MNDPNSSKTCWLAAVFLSFAACSSGNAPAVIMELRAVSPTVIAGQTATVLTLECDAPANEDVFLELGDDRQIPVTVISETEARATVPAGTLAPGVYDLTLKSSSGRSDTMLGGLEVAAEPRLDAFDPPVIDRMLRMPFHLTGHALRAPLVVQFLDENGELIAAADAVVAADGRSAEGLTPTLGGSGRVAASIQVEDDLGQSAATALVVAYGDAYRTADGSSNNERDSERGAAGVALLRKVASAYGDGVSSIDTERPNPRAISNAVFDQGDDDIENAANASDYLWQWGQFVDHDIDLSLEADPEEAAPIDVPTGDPDFDPLSNGTVVLAFHRSDHIAASSPREQTNSITAYIDASNVYGSDDTRAAALRMLDGTGHLKTSDGELLPFNDSGLPNAGGTDASLFVAGDVRANEQVGLLAMHTLFVREHNRLADEIAQRFPALNGEEIYQAARRIVGAQMQAITFREFLPGLLGANAIPAYVGYESQVDASIANVFSTAAFRLGHSLLSPTLLRVDSNGAEIAAGHLPLADAFFSPTRFVEGGLDSVLRGLASQRAQELDAKLVDGVRNFLFGQPGAGGLDLAALNIQRGRDHGLGSYNDARRAYGLRAVASFADVTSDPDVQAQLALVYADVDEIDVWVGALAEDDVAGSMVGPLLQAIVGDQFTRLRDGDRYWYERRVGGAVLADVQGTTLADIIRRNTSIDAELPDDVFKVSAPLRRTP